MHKTSQLIHTLPNGLQLLGEISPNRQSAALGYFVKTGARDENTKEAGISHFLEHMVFKGTKKRSALDITYQLGNIGAQANAYTSEELTVYYAAILPEYLKNFQELLTDMLYPALDPQEFDTEKKVIIEEIALYQDRPSYYLYEKAVADFFSGNTVGNSVIGTPDSVSGITVEDMRNYHARRYSPSNIILVATGKFDWDKFVQDAEKLTTAWESKEVLRSYADHQINVTQKTFTKANLNQAHLMFVSKGAAAQDEERFALGLLALILGDSTGSKFYWELLDKGLVDSVGADNEEKDQAAYFMSYASTDLDKLDLVSSIFRKILSNPMDFTDAELARAKSKLLTRIVLSGELPMSRLMALGTAWVYRKEFHTLQTSIDKIKSVTKSDIEKAVKKYEINKYSEYCLIPE